MLFAALAVAVLCGCAGADSNDACAQSEDFARLLNSVVKIDVWERTQDDGSSRIIRSVGSGAIMDKDGYIITNAHVVNLYAERIVVTLANLERVSARFVGWDHWTDLAVIRLDMDEIKRRGLSFTWASFGNSDALFAGETVYAVGTPHGFARTATKGIISNTGRYFEGTLLGSGYETGLFNTWIQTDAAINPGNSGGPLADAQGRIVGINTRGYLGANNLSFSIPSNVASFVMARIIAEGSVTRGYAGITPAPLQDMESFYELDVNRGVLIRNVDAGSPASRAGVMPGDILLSVNGADVDGRFPEQLPAIVNSIASLPVGSKVSLLILRGGKERTFELETERLESRVGEEFALEKWGVGIRQITSVYAREAKLDTDSKLLVIGVRNGFPFDIAEIYDGYIIISVNRKKVRTRADIEAAYAEYVKDPKETLIEVMRDRTISFHVLKPSGK